MPLWMKESSRFSLKTVSFKNNNTHTHMHTLFFFLFLSFFFFFFSKLLAFAEVVRLEKEAECKIAKDRFGNNRNFD